MIYATDFPPGVKAEDHYGAHTQRLVEHGMGEIWECDCEEYRMPATIEDPATLDEVMAALISIGYGKSEE